MPVGFLSYFTPSKQGNAAAVVVVEEKVTVQAQAAADSRSSEESTEAPSLSPVDSHTPEPEQVTPPGATLGRVAQSTPNLTGPTAATAEQPPKRARKISFKRFSVTSGTKAPVRAPFHDTRHHNPALSTIQEHETHERAAKRAGSLPARLVKPNTDKRAEESAVIVRTLILGTPMSTTKVTKAVAKPKMYGQVKSQLIKPKSANKVIARLRCLSAEGGDFDHDHRPKGPIHAVCLSQPDHEAQELHFSKLKPKPKSKPIESNAETVSAQVEEFTSVVTASVETVTELFRDLQVVSLIKDDFGLGQPGDGPGLLAGALPTAETIINGFEQITPQLMALGFAAGKTILPDHTGVHPPTDRMSILTYWWGFELLLPEPSLSFLNTCHNISGTVMNFVSALAMVNNGVRELVPFIRYISQFIDFEYKVINAQDTGNGVVCAATWIMPAAMVPRAWDFDPAPKDSVKVPTVPSSPPREQQSGGGTGFPAAPLPPIMNPMPSLTISSPTNSFDTASSSVAETTTPATVAATA